MTRGTPRAQPRRGGARPGPAGARAVSGATWLDRAPRWLIPAGCVIVALAMRLWAHAYQPYVTVDGTEYIRFAESLARGQAFASIFPPGYPVLVALARLIVTDRLLAAAGVSIVCGALLPWPVWHLARRVVGERLAPMPALAVALHPELARISSVTLSEAAYFLALYTGLALAARPLRSGLALGAAFAIRPEGLLCAAAMAARDGIRSVRGSRAPRSAALLAAGFLLLATPCWLYFRATLGEWTVTPKIVALRAPSSDWRVQEPRLERTAAGSRYGFSERLRRDGRAALSAYPSQALGYGRLLLGLWPWPLLVLSLWGLLRRPGEEWFALLPMALLPLIGGLGLQPRLLLGAIPALAILAARPWAEAGRARWRVLVAGIGLAGAVWCALANAHAFRTPFDFYQEDQKDAGQWLALHSAPEDLVMDRKPYVAFYANRPYRVIPDEPYDTLLTAVLHAGARYLVLDEGVVRVFRPQLNPLLFDPGFRDREQRLEMVYLAGRLKGFNVSIFRVLRPGEQKTGKPPYFDVRWLRPAGP